MKWIANVLDPSRSDALEHITRIGDETPRQARKRQQAWLANKVIGEPYSNDAKHQQSLKDRGWVGVYVDDLPKEKEVIAVYIDERDCTPNVEPVAEVPSLEIQAITLTPEQVQDIKDVLAQPAAQLEMKPLPPFDSRELPIFKESSNATDADAK